MSTPHRQGHPIIYTLTVLISIAVGWWYADQNVPLWAFLLLAPFGFLLGIAGYHFAAWWEDQSWTP